MKFYAVENFKLNAGETGFEYFYDRRYLSPNDFMENEYKFGDQIKFTSGFYEGHEGTLTGVSPSLDKKDAPSYDVEFETAGHAYYIQSSEFELKSVLKLAKDSIEKAN